MPTPKHSIHSGNFTRQRQPTSKYRLKKPQLSFYPEPSDYEALKALSMRTGVPQQVYLRRGLVQILATEDSVGIAMVIKTLRDRSRQILSKCMEADDASRRLVAYSRAQLGAA